jgi:hypothetical protein
LLHSSLLAGFRDPAISLKAHQTNLGLVLEEISKKTATKIILEEKWTKVPVSIQLEKTPLQTALRRILNGLNNALIYQGQDTIRILIFESSPDGGIMVGSPSSIALSGEPEDISAETPALPELPGQLFDAETMVAMSDEKVELEDVEMKLPDSIE